MANAIPLLAGTDASGGYLVEDALGPVLVNGINRESAVMALSRTQRISTSKERFPVYAGRPTAAFVAEGAAKTATGAEFAELSVDVKKLASIVLYTDEVLEDARIDPTVLINADVSAAFADTIDSHAIGRNAAGVITSQFNSELSETSQTAELGTGDDALAVAVSSAMSTIESNGYRPSGLVLATDGKAHLRAARGPGDNAASPLYTDGFNREPDALYGLPIRYTTNLQTFAGAAAAGRVVGIVGDFSHAIAVVRNDIRMSASNQATVDVSGTLHHTWQQNKTAVRWEMRVGFVAHDLDKAFVAIINAA
jgi:HK97 family phage major capsid protein